MATNNRGKLAEFRRLLGERFELLSLDDVDLDVELVEPYDSYWENAQKKAEAVARVTGLPTLADDSGIEVHALGNFPGVRSARWMGPEASDRDRLLGLLERVAREAPHDRRASYVASVALAVPGSDTVITTDACYGELVDPPRGERGFGYDPAFLSDDLGITFGEADDAAKDTCSHRAKALRLMLQVRVLDAISGPDRPS